MNRYSRSALTEPLRRFLRAIDLIVLLKVLRRRRMLPNAPALRQMVFIELGPGPMRLASLKRSMFGEVFFLDQSDFGVSDPGLRIANIEDYKDAKRVVTDVCGLDPKRQVLFFADHCMEHLSSKTVLRFFHSVVDNGYQACFRVPNVLSARGLHSFGNDSTHQTAFEPELRDQIKTLGFQIMPWIRWYRFQIKSLFSAKSRMKYAEEIALCAPCVQTRAEVQRREPETLAAMEKDR